MFCGKKGKLKKQTLAVKTANPGGEVKDDTVSYQSGVSRVTRNLTETVK